MTEALRMAAVNDGYPAALPTEALLDLLPVGVYSCDAQGRITAFNKRAAEIWGREPRVGDSQELFCGSFKVFMPDGTLIHRDQTPMAAALRTGAVFRDTEAIVERPDGSRIWASVNIDPLFDGDGNITGAVNCFQDISRRKEAENALRRSEAFLSTVVETTPECIKIVARDGSLRQMNSAGLAMIEADGFGAVDHACVFELIAPENRAQWQGNHARVCDGESLSWEFDLVGLGGALRHMETHAVPFELPDGEAAQLAITRDVTERKRSERALSASRKWFADLLQALPVAVYTTDADGRITLFNTAAEEMWGRAPEAGEMWCGSYKLFQPDGTALPHDQCPMAIALKENRPIQDVEAILERPDGKLIPFTPFPTPLRDEAGNLVGAVNMLVDISHHKDASERQQLLINELNHRVKNTLALVQSIARMTMRSSDALPDFNQAFTARLAALSRAHDLLNGSWWESLSLRTAVEAEFAPFGAGERIVLDGEDVALTPRQGISLTLILHELATNAARHGALSAPQGRLEVRWKRQTMDSGEGPVPLLALSWKESGGPPVGPLAREGFGTALIQRSVQGDLGGTIEQSFDGNGYSCTIRFALSE